MTAAIAALLIAATATTIWIVGGAAGAAYVLLLTLACLPGLPLGFALFGRHHASGWIAGVLLGYAVTTFTVWLVVFAGVPSTPLFGASWAVAGLALWLVTRRVREPLVVLPRWTSRDTTALLLLLLLAPGLLVRPFDRLGSEDAQHNRQYRAYFIADFVWHTALTSELARQDPRPSNPFLSPERLHYYWTYFRLPATLTAETGFDIQRSLKVNAVATALLLLSAIYLAAWVAIPAWPLTVALAVALTVVAPSAEGIAGIADVVRRGLPLAALRDLNIDALAAWAFKGLRIDNLPRTMWYTPQHGFSCALGLLAIPVAVGAGTGATPAAIILAGCALGAALAFNPLLGATFCGVYGIAILADTLRTGRPIKHALRHALAVIPVVLALGWCLLNDVGDGAGWALQFGFRGTARNATAVSFLLQFGPLLPLIVLGLWPESSTPWQAAVPAIAGVAIAILVMHLVALTVDPAWVGFRAGNIFFVLVPALVARGLIRLLTRERRGAAIRLVALVLLAGAPTTLIDAYNAQDVGNRHLSRDAERVRVGPVPFDPDAEFHWTMIVTRQQQEAFDWIRANTPKDAVVQFEPTARGRETWGILPAFGERRMAAGHALPLLPTPLSGERNARVREIFASNDAEGAWQTARALGIGYLYVDAIERTTYPNVSKFDHASERFTPVFTNSGATIYAVRP